MSATLGQHDHLTRQLDLIPVATLHTPITVIGCGAIGSFTTLALAKMGMAELVGFDHDQVSIENMSNQFFRFKDIGHNKALALGSLVKEFTNQEIETHARKFAYDDAAHANGIVVVAVDDMDARRMIYEAIKETGFNVKLLIDPRMGAEFYAQYSINPFNEKDQEMYAKTLHSNESAVQEACTAKSTVYTATLAAGMITKTIKNWMLEQDYPRTVQWNIAASANSPLSVYPGNGSARLM